MAPLPEHHEGPPPPMTPELGSPIEVLQPDAGALPLVISSPHSGQIYPPSMLQELRLPLEQLRCLEDGQVDRLFGAAPELGAPLLSARFARAYVDPNREVFELDAGLFHGLPDHVNATSVRARAGLGTIPSRIAGEDIYRWRLPFDEAEERVRLAYWPYHQALQSLIGQARAAFGTVLLLDCHSMPSLTPNGAAATDGAIDFALGDRFGRTCSPLVVERIEATLCRHGFRVARNRPYAGGHITARYGRPDADVHALQIEVRRGLFMEEKTRRPHRAMARLQEVIRELLDDVGWFMVERLTPAPSSSGWLRTAS
jgi:N-formylglutamate amidohydrolase